MNNKKFLLIRTDKIGDCITILPAIGLLRKKYPAAHIAVFCREYTADIFKHNPHISEIIIKTSFLQDLRTIRAKKFDAAIIFFLNEYAGWLAFLSRIPLRIGPVSKIWAFLLNKRIKQNRSLELKHEADYNIDLLAPLGVNFEETKPKIYLTNEENTKARIYLKEKFGITENDFLVIVHPGSGGSARNWPLENFGALTNKILNAYPDIKILLTGSPAEADLLAAITGSVKSGEAIRNIFPLNDKMSLRDFMAIINQCRIFIANSTGPLHIAAALNKKTMSFYPNIKGCLPVRWKPYGQGHTVLVAGGGKPKFKKYCDKNFMKAIVPQAAFEVFEKQI